MSSPQVAFDVNAARQARYSEDEILQHLTQTRNFDVQSALKAGYSKSDIIGHLSSTSAPQQAQSPEDSLGITSGLSGATISPAPTGAGAWLDSLKADLLHGTGTTAIGQFLSNIGAPGLEKGISPATANMAGGPIIGPVRAAHGITQLPEHPVKGTNEIISGVGQTLALPLAVTNPGFMAFAAPGMVAQQGIEKTAKALGMSPDYAELIGNVAGVGAGAKLVGMLRAGSKVAPELSNKVAAKILTDAVNPNAAEMPKYQSTLEEQLPAVTEYAKINNLPIKNKADLAAAMKSAADTKRAQFQGLVDATGDQTASTNNIPGYGGATKTYGTASIRQIYDRLTQVNSELFNPYSKASGRASGAAVKSTGDLAAEAAALRNTLYSEMAKHTGKDAGTLADINGSSGALGYLAEKTQLAADAERYAQNKANQGPVSISPFTSKNFILDKLINKMRGNPADKSITSTLQQQADARTDAASPGEADALKRYMGMGAPEDAQAGGGQGGQPGTPPSPAPSKSDLRVYYDTRINEIRGQMARAASSKETTELQQQMDALKLLMRVHSIPVAGQ